MAAQWHKLPTTLAELCIATTLRCGQSFRWRKSADDIWSCALHGRVLSLRQDAEAVHYRALFPANNIPPADDTLALLHHYFNLAPDLSRLYQQWATADPNFKKRAPAFAGVRVLRQDAWEALIGFICSSNNNIIRISSMVHNLCLHYGPLVAHIDDVPYHDFPTPQALSGPDVEAHLAKLGFGYRAKYIAKTARMVADDKGLDWLHELSNPECPQFGQGVKPAGEMQDGGRDGYRKAHEELLALHGVGPKVADCVCLFGLGWSESVPVDTHVWQIAQRDYKFGKGKHSSLTPATYVAVGNHFRKLWGKEAGWAHSVLFTADLKAFSGRVKTEIKEEVVKQEDSEVIESVKQETEVVTEGIEQDGQEDVKQENSPAVEQKSVKTKTTRKRIKTEPEDENSAVKVEEETQVMRRSKRRRV